MGKALSELDSVISDIQLLKSKTNVILRVMWPSTTDLAISNALSRLGIQKMELQKKQHNLSSKFVITRAEVFELLSDSGLLKDTVFSSIRNTERRRKEDELNLRKMIDDAQTELVKHRIETMVFLKNKFEALRDKMRKSLKPDIDNLTSTYEKAKAEAAKLGKT